MIWKRKNKTHAYKLHLGQVKICLDAGPVREEYKRASYLGPVGT